MGAWGAGLYQDDVTCDIKEDYLDRLRIGYSNEEATDEVIEYNLDYIEDEDDGPLFWFALADTQWKYGRLLPKVKKEALKHLKSGKDLERWQENKRLYGKRKQVLKNLEEELNSPQPPEKKVTKLVIKKANWQVGDVLLYQIHDVEFEKHKWYKKYILFRVIAKTETNIGSLPREYSHEQNVVALYNWIGDEVPELKILPNLDLINEIKEYKKMDRLTQGKYILWFNSRQLKKLNLKVMINDPNYKKESEHYVLGVRMYWLNTNNMEYQFIKDLEYAETAGLLIDDTEN